MVSGALVASPGPPVFVGGEREVADPLNHASS